MRRSTAWWITGLAIIVVGSTAAIFNAKLLSLPGGAIYLIAGCFGYTVVAAILPLILGAITRFRYPWLVLGTFLGLVLLATWGVHHSRPSTVADAYSYFNDVQQSINTCTRSGNAPLSCYTNGSPKRCQAQAVALFAGAGDDNGPTPQRLWSLCVMSCAGSNARECERQTF